MLIVYFLSDTHDKRMSFHHYRIDKLANEERLLREKLKMESKIRKQKEKKRHSKTMEGQRYSRTFEPVRNSLNELKNIQKSITPVEENLIDVEDDTDHLPPPMISIKEQKPSTLYIRAIQSIPRKNLDDGVFGLNVQTNRIGANTFHVSGDTLITMNDVNGSTKSFDINDYKLWQLLLVKRPSSIGLDLKTNQKLLQDYIDIVDTLDLVQDAEESRIPYRNRAKFKLLSRKHGSGFLFSTRPPLFHPSTVVLPSDKKGLLRELLLAVAELRAGNTSMQNLVVPLAKEAKRKGILPRNLLTADEMTWIFA